ncbi:MAG: hypothetical protein Fur0032_02400 [Terrimicrobiaceae bacterium]
MMASSLAWFCSSFVAIAAWGIAHFLTAIPAGRGMGLPVPIAALAATLGYAAVTGIVVFAGEGLRKWLVRKFSLRIEPDPSKFLWRVWLKAGLPGLAILAPVTCGPYIAAVLALGLGERPMRTWLWIVAGVLPWAVAFAVMTAWAAQGVGGGHIE